MDLMGYANDASKIELERRNLGLSAERLHLQESEFEDNHILNQQNIESNKFKLIGQALGLKNEATEQEAFKLYNPNDETSLDRVAQYLGQHGDPKGAMDIIKERTNEKRLDQDALFKRAEAQAKEASNVAGVTSTMTDADSYRNGYEQITKSGIDPRKYGLVPEYSPAMQARASQITKAGISVGTQAELLARDKNEQRLLAAQEERFRKDQARLDQSDRRLDLQEKQQDLREFIADLKDKQLKAIQAGREQKGLNDVADYGRKIEPKLGGVALAIVESDPGLHSELSDAQKQVLAKRAVAQVIAEQSKGAKTTGDLNGVSWEEEIEAAIDKIKTDPEFKHTNMAERFFLREKSKLPPAATGKPGRSAAGKVGGVDATPKTGYKIGDMVENRKSGGHWKVVGLDTDGTPLFEEESPGRAKLYP